MNTKLTILKPTILTLVTTFKCTAQCKNCCFGCNQKQGKTMTYKDMKYYVDSCLLEYHDSLKVLVITGGECMIYKANVYRIIKYATKLGLSTRIVTNAFWATSYKDAYSTITELKKAGLKEINFSTGDDHRKWVPLKNVRNAAVAASRLGFSP